MLTSAAAQDGPAGVTPWMPPPEIHEWRAVSELPNRQPFEYVSKLCETRSEESFYATEWKELGHWRLHYLIDNAYKDCMARNGYIYVVTPVEK
jgi:hypothetical protein